MDQRIDISSVEDFMEVNFTYSVTWYEDGAVEWKDRFTRYHHLRFFPPDFNDENWFFVFNSLLAIAFLSMYMAYVFRKVLKDDMSTQMDLDGEAQQGQTERVSVLAHDDDNTTAPYP